MSGHGRPLRWPGLVALASLLAAAPAHTQEGEFLSEAEAPAAVFPEGDRLERREIVATEALRSRMQEHLGTVQVSIWEDRWVMFRVERAGHVLGHAFIVEEIGKHRPITFVVGLAPDGKVRDVAVMAYREPYGGEVRQARFLRQYRDKGLADPMRPYREIKNIAGATLSVEAAGRAVRKAQALSTALDVQSP